MSSVYLAETQSKIKASNLTQCVMSHKGKTHVRRKIPSVEECKNYMNRSKLLG